MRVPWVARTAVAASLTLVLGSAPATAAPELDAASSDVTLHVESDDGYRPVIDFIRSAKRTLDYNIYQFNDGRIARELRRAHDRGVDVRVIFTWQVFGSDSNLWDSSSYSYNTNMPTFNALKRAGIKVHLSPFPYTYSHEKTMIADGRTANGRALIMDFNAQPSYFGPAPAQGQVGTRGFAITTANRRDVAEIQATFDADWNRRTPPPFISPHLVWSPNGVGYEPKSAGKERLYALLDSARISLDLYVLLLDFLPFQDRLIAAAQRGVDVRIITNTDPEPMTFGQVKALSDAGVRFAFDPRYAQGTMFIHSKAIMRDAGSPHAMVFVGSENPGDNVSLNSERELGILVDRRSIVDRMHRIFERDWARATPLSFEAGAPVDPFRARAAN